MDNNNKRIAIAIVAMFVVALSIIGFTYAYFTFFNKDYYLVKYTDKPTYINQQCKFNVYSMLIHGTWIEPDEEIWFEPTKNIQAYWQDWFRKKDEILKSLDSDDICVMLDCVA